MFTNYETNLLSNSGSDPANECVGLLAIHNHECKVEKFDFAGAISPN
jgi:hypothetical protein